MTLADFLSAFDGSNVLITVSDIDTDVIIKFYPSSDNALDDTLEARTVKKIKVTGATALQIILNSAE